MAFRALGQVVEESQSWSDNGDGKSNQKARQEVKSGNLVDWFRKVSEVGWNNQVESSLLPNFVRVTPGAKSMVPLFSFPNIRPQLGTGVAWSDVQVVQVSVGFRRTRKARDRSPELAGGPAQFRSLSK